MMHYRGISLQQQFGAFFGYECQHLAIVIPIPRFSRLHLQHENPFGLIGVFLMNGNFQGPNVDVWGDGPGVRDSFMRLDYVVNRILKNVFIAA